jgi:hypothetical protein
LRQFVVKIDRNSRPPILGFVFIRVAIPQQGIYLPSVLVDEIVPLKRGGDPCGDWQLVEQYL